MWLSGAWTPGVQLEKLRLYGSTMLSKRLGSEVFPKRPAPGESYRHQVASMQLSCGARAGLK